MLIVNENYHGLSDSPAVRLNKSSGQCVIGEYRVDTYCSVLFNFFDCRTVMYKSICSNGNGPYFQTFKKYTLASDIIYVYYNNAITPIVRYIVYIVSFYFFIAII